MQPVIAVIAPGAMGSAISQRLIEHGLEVITSLNGRSAASSERALAAEMRPVPEAELAEAKILLSIIPPGQAVALSEQLSGILAGSPRKPIYADCNAVSPLRVKQIGEIINSAGMRFVDAGIIGGPPKLGKPGPVIYTSGPDASALNILADHGLDIKDLKAPIGAASGLKMSYAGITKGTTALATAMLLAATRFGVDDALRQELAASQPHMLARFQHGIPDMLPKAYRWVAEMEEIADFAGEDQGMAIYRGIAQLYQAIAEDYSGDRKLIGELTAFLKS